MSAGGQRSLAELAVPVPQGQISILAQSQTSAFFPPRSCKCEWFLRSCMFPSARHLERERPFRPLCILRWSAPTIVRESDHFGRCASSDVCVRHLASMRVPITCLPCKHGQPSYGKLPLRCKYQVQHICEAAHLVMPKPERFARIW